MTEIISWNLLKSRIVILCVIVATALPLVFLSGLAQGRTFSDTTNGERTIHLDQSRLLPCNPVKKTACLRLATKELPANDQQSEVQLDLRNKIEFGSPNEKMLALSDFLENKQPALAPIVINAILDDTVLPRQQDTGWGTIYHLAATAIGEFARSYDGISKKERGYDAYSFHRDVGTADENRRREVHENWVSWWKINQIRIRPQ